ncbi:MAG TPA: GNAT family N-acetyltransferase [bacterium]|jgi:ribosomal protein S18 acetylase RimI-like enzyme
MVHIRRATARDIKEILPVWGELAVYHADLDPAFTPSPEWPYEYGAYLRALIGREDALAVIARDGPRLVGYAVGRITSLPSFFEHRSRGYIHDVYVRETHRHRGIGRRLVEEILTWFAGRNVTLVELTVAANNGEAALFWHALGFETYMHQMKRLL